MCDFCEKFDFGAAKTDVDRFGASIILSGGSYRFPMHEQFNYCPRCGAARKSSLKNTANDQSRKRLYLIATAGAEATTRGIAEMSDDELIFFLKIIKDQNRNAWYDCMPTTWVYQISWNMLKETVVIDEHSSQIDHKFFYNGKVYTWADDEFDGYMEMFRRVVLDDDGCIIRKSLS